MEGACKGDALRENGPFSTASQDADCGTARRGGKGERTSGLSVRSLVEMARTSRGIEGDTLPIHPFVGDGIFVGRPLLLRCCSIVEWRTPDGWLDRSRKPCITELTSAYTLDGGRINSDDNPPSSVHSQCQVKRGRWRLCPRRLSVLQASACVWVAAEWLASRMHDAGKRWEPIHHRCLCRELGSLPLSLILKRSPDQV